MSADIEKWVGQIVTVMMNDGRILVGLQKAFDQKTNIVLESCHERIFSPDSPVDIISRGLYMVRGDQVVALGNINEDRDLELDFNQIRGEYLKPLLH